MKENNIIKLPFKVFMAAEKENIILIQVKVTGVYDGYLIMAGATYQALKYRSKTGIDYIRVWPCGGRTTFEYARLYPKDIIVLTGGIALRDRPYSKRKIDLE